MQTGIGGGGGVYLDIYSSTLGYIVLTSTLIYSSTLGYVVLRRGGGILYHILGLIIRGCGTLLGSDLERELGFF